ncbi:MAG: exodeoxyribonuclease V subunit alpha [Burkholderiales bacterium]
MKSVMSTDAVQEVDLAGPVASLLAELKSWSEEGWIRRLDASFASFVSEFSANVQPGLILLAALVAHMEGRGHSCLAIDELLADPTQLLGWPPEAMERLRAELAQLPDEVSRWLEVIRTSPVVRADGAPESMGVPANTPLVLRGAKLYLRRYWGYERQVAGQVLARSAAADVVDVQVARRWLDILFDTGPHARAGSGEPRVDWQKVACAIALRGRLSIVTGGPGTGKTYTVARLLALLYAMAPEPQRLRVALAAPTGKAAGRLKQSIDRSLAELQPRLAAFPDLHDLGARIGPARTLHSLLGARPDTRRFAFDAAHPLEVDVLVVDEASMVHLEMMSGLLAALPPDARVILLGDKDQLASVEAGAVLGDLCRDAEAGRYTEESAQFIHAATGQMLPATFVSDGPFLAQQTVMLRESFRFGGPIGQLALAANAGDESAAAALLRADSGLALQWIDARAPTSIVQLALQGRNGAVGGYRSYLQLMKHRPTLITEESHLAWVTSVLKSYDRFRLLCAVREGSWGATGLNVAVERALAEVGLLNRRGLWYEGKPVMVTRNDSSLGVYNGDIGIVLRPLEAGAPLRAYFMDGSAVRSVGVSRLSDVETAFAMTVHKAQGSEFEHTVLVLPQEPSRVLTRELVYTGITRARAAFTLVTGRTQSLADALASRTRRSSGLSERIASA